MRRDELSLPDPPPHDRPGDRWACGRRDSDSPCSQGPNRRGRCPLAEACRPRRTWHGRRSQLVAIAIAAIVACLALLTQSNRRADLFKPGELTTAHAQILSATDASNRCAACHPQAATAGSSWFSFNLAGHAEFQDPSDLSQTDRCLKCHHVTIQRSSATLAHNLPEQTRQSIRLAGTGRTEHSWHDLLPGPAINQDNIQCNACHREHGGPGKDLSAVSDHQCQSCHADRFGSFATSHPDWDRWPYGRGRRIGFNHATHANQHFPSTKHGDGVAQFQCADCHHKTDDNELTRVTTFERGCKSCHQQGLNIQIADGIDLLALPTLPVETAEQVGRWPAEAIGFYDGQIGPIAELLLRTQTVAERSLRDLPDGSFGRLDPTDPQSAVTAQRIAREYRSLLEQVGARGQSVIISRIAANGISRSAASSFVQAMPTQLIADATQRWFGDDSDPRSEAASGHRYARPMIAAKPDTASSDGNDDLLGNEDDLLGDDDELLSGDDELLSDDDELLGDDDELLGGDDELLGGDPLDADPLAVGAETIPIESSTRFDPETMLPQGGWYRDDLVMAIRYRGGEHADPVLKSTIDIISQLPTSDPVHQKLLQNQAVRACIRCHPGAVAATNQWQSESWIGRRRDFTKFAHAPHLNIAKLADCVQCHQIASPQTKTDTVTSVSNSGVWEDPFDFAPLTRGTCANCHTPHAAGDSCVKCHRYHIDLRYQSP